MPFDLEDMVYDEVSLVDKGANQFADVLIYKRAKDEDEVDKSVYDRRGDQVKCSCGKMYDKDRSTCPGCGEKNTKKKALVKRLIELLKAADEETETDDEREVDEDEVNKGVPALLEDGQLNPKIQSEIWDFNYLFGRAISSIMLAGDIDQQAAVGNSIEQFMDAIRAAATQWLNGRTISKADDTDSAAKREARLRDLVKRVSSLVSEGDTSMGDKNKDKTAELPEDLDDKVVEKLDPKVKAYIDDLKKQASGLDSDLLAKQDKEVQEYIASLEKAAKGTKEKEEDKKDDKEEGKQEDKEVEKKAKEEEIFKGLSPEAVEIVKQAQKTAEEAKEELAKSADAKALSDEVTLAKGFTHLGQDYDEVGKALHELKKAGQTKAYDSMVKALTAANEQAKQANIFKTYGRGGVDSDSDAINKRAKELMGGEDKITKEQAIAKAYEENPEKYEEELRATR